MDFLSSHEPSQMFLSIMTIAELRRGAENSHIANTEKDINLHSWIDILEKEDFGGRVLGITPEIAAVWGKLAGSGRTRPILDMFIAATAIVHNLTLVTRNERDFADIPVKLLNPWKP